TAQATGPGSTNNFGGFTSGNDYVLTFTFQRTLSNAMAITMSWFNPTNGASLTTSVTDNTATNFSFDGIAMRPQDNANAASTISFHEARIEYVAGNTPPSITSDPQSQSIFVGQTASFGVLASGTAPLSYQWLYNTNSILTNATSSSLVI